MSDCGVCLNGFEGEQAEFYSITTPKARKEHKCEECGRTIPMGTVYQKVAGRFDGDFYSQDTCMDCEEIRRAFTCPESTECTNGLLWEDIYEVVFPRLTTACFAKVKTESARTLLRERWLQWKGLTP
jgi:ssDNA-binding Zn-finger/Zn-ribbon topoisomerase 1